MTPLSPTPSFRAAPSLKSTIRPFTYGPETRDNPHIASVLSEGRTRASKLFYLSYRAAPDEVGFAKVFDFSRATTGDRWREGAGDMHAAMRELHESENDGEVGLDVLSIPAGARSPRTLDYAG